jgi:hypothetical protein
VTGTGLSGYVPSAVRPSPAGSARRGCTSTDHGRPTVVAEVEELLDTEGEGGRIQPRCDLLRSLSYGIKRSAEMKKYESPRAVRLSDANTASLVCVDGPQGTADVCASGFAVEPINICTVGSDVRF